ncbi:MAG TPA: hypothetical protein VGA38_11685 [Candidatus Limnocylindria bacterium]
MASDFLKDGALFREPDTLGMEKYHFIDVIEHDRRSRIPRTEWPLIPFSLFVGTFFTFLTASFHDNGAIPASTWEAIAVLFMSLMLVLTVALAVWWLIDAIDGLFAPSKARDRDPGELWESIKDQATLDNARAEARRKAREKSAAVVENKPLTDAKQSGS